MVGNMGDHAPVLGTSALTRRDALHWVTGAIIASIVGTRLLRFGVSRDAVGLSMANLRLDALRPLVGESFLLSHGDVTLSLTLEQARDLWRTRSRTGAVGPRPEYFSLLFGGPADAPLGQGTYPFHHRVLGTLWLFVVPMASDGRRQLYEAVINHQQSPDDGVSASAQTP